MRKFLKRFTALSLACVLILLCSQGFAATAAAYSPKDDNASRHRCSFYQTDKTILYCISSTHPYLVGQNMYPDGHIEPLYEECTVFAYQYRWLWKCDCGKTNGYYFEPDIVHEECGQ